ncbi:MAG: hypothetical protein IKN92_05380 [Clostridia bacterium]|nr:hypothetical protein [Clostridia bacterium]
MLKKIVAILLAVTVMCLGACAKKSEKENVSGTVQIPNPMKEFKNLEEAAKDSKMKVKLPETIKGLKQNSFFTYSSEILEVRYGDDKIYVRVAGSGDDISGDYDEYKWSASMDKDGYKFTAYGESDTAFKKVTGEKNGHVYSITSEEAMSIEEIKGIIDAIIFE